MKFAGGIPTILKGKLTEIVGRADIIFYGRRTGQGHQMRDAVLCAFAQPNVISIEGALDFSTSRYLTDRLNDLTQIKTLKIDLRKTKYIDAAGLGVLVAAMKLRREQGYDVILITTSPNIRKKLQVTGLDRLFILKDEI